MTELSVKQIAEMTGAELSGNASKIIKGISTDSRKCTDDDLFVALKGERFDGNDYLESLENKVGAAITDRAVSLSYPTLKVGDTLKALGALAAAYIKTVVSPSVKVALTGSVGKTTTKEMVSSVLSTTYKTAYTKGNFNNHIGVPLTLLSADKDDEALVVEMGMNHKGELEYLTSLVESDIAIITNIGHSHIENLGSREGIRDAKLEILGGVKKGGTLIIPGDEPLLEKIDFDGRIIRVGTTPECDIWAENISMSDSKIKYTLHAFDKASEITLPCTGGHNAINSLFAVAVGCICKIDLDRIQSGLLNYKSVGLRQNIYFKNGVRVIADCYNAGVESMSASLTLLSQLSCEGRRIAVLSDMLELGGISNQVHENVGKKAHECNIDILYTLGELSRLTNKKAAELGVFTKHFETKSELAEELKSILKKGDTVLFKASHSMKLEEVIHLADLEIKTDGE